MGCIVVCSLSSRERNMYAAAASRIDSALPDKRMPPPWQAPPPAFEFYAAMLDEIDYGMLLVSPGLRLLSCNHAARMVLRADHPLRQRDDQLHAATANDDLRLREAVEAAASRSRRSLITLQGGGSSKSVAVVPLQGEPGLGTAAVLLVLGRQEICARLSAQRLASEHGLTQAESAVLCALVEGADPREIADRHGVKLSTVRTQVRSVFTKVGVRRARDLVMRVATLPPLVDALRF